ncbi:MAG: methionyl-tRNA formyltransferase [Spirochaetia bacterium]
MRVLFAGGSQISVPSLRKIAENHDVVSVLTHPDKRAGRGRKSSQNPVKAEALLLDLPVLETEKLDADFREQAEKLDPEILVVVSYGKIFGPKSLSLFPRGGVNLHPSLLPKYRGPSPIQAAILSGDEKTGITVQRLAPAMDSGAVLEQEEIPLSGRETAGELTDRVAGPGAEMLQRVLARIEAGTERETPQAEDEATYCTLITQEDAVIEWGRSAVQIDREVRAYNPWPKARSSFSGKPLFILEAEPAGPGDNPAGPPGKVTGVDKNSGILVQTGNGTLSLKRLQLGGKKPLDWKSFLNGVHGFVGTVLGAEE